MSMEEWVQGFEVFARQMQMEHNAAVQIQAIQRGDRARYMAQSRTAYRNFKESGGFKQRTPTVEELLSKQPRYRDHMKCHEKLPYYQWRLLCFMEHRWIKALFLGLVVLNGVVIGIQADDQNPDHEGTWNAIESAFVGLFTIEVMLKHIAMGRHFWYDWWNSFDFFVVAISFVDIVVRASVDPSGGGPGSVISVMRMMRVLRVLLLIYMFAVLGQGLIGSSGELLDDPASREAAENYRNLPEAVATLLQIMTQDSAMAASRPLGEKQQWIWVFLLLWLAMSSVGLLNLLTAIFIDSLTELSREAEEAQKVLIQDKRYAVMKFIAESFCKFDKDQSNSLELKEVEALLRAIERSMQRELQLLGIDMSGIRDLLLASDSNTNAQIDSRSF